MDWSNERYVRLYVRDTTTWKRLRFDGQATFALLLRKLDRAGILEIDDMQPWEAAVVHAEIPEDIARAGMQRLLDLKVFEHAGSKLVLPNFVEAQEATMSGGFRQQEHRLRRRDAARSGLSPSQREMAIYFVQSEHGGDVKIGRAEDVAQRLVNMQTSRPDKLVILAACPGSTDDEKALHDLFAEHRIKGEWFSPAADLMTLIADVVKDGSRALPTRFVSQSVTPNDSSRIVTPNDSSRKNTAQVGSGNETINVTPYLALPSVPSVLSEFPSRAHEEQSPIQDHLSGIGQSHVQELAEVARTVLDERQQRETLAKLGAEQTRLIAAHVRDLASAHGVSFAASARKLVGAFLDARTAPGGAGTRWAFFGAEHDPWAPPAGAQVPSRARAGRVEPAPGTSQDDFGEVEDLDEQLKRLE